ncbi:MAG: ATP-grasp domain-containing protein [Candidatus Omnitrophota bacterium]
MAFNVGLTYDLKTDLKQEGGQPEDINAEFDAPETVEMIAECIEQNEHKVVRIGHAKSLIANIAKIKQDVDIVFNICEGVQGRNREAQAPIILEMWGIPFVGADGLTLSLTLDKAMCKKVFIAEGIPTAKYAVVNDASRINGCCDHLNFPLIIKPRYEGSSKGLSLRSRVQNKQDLKKQTDYIISTYHQPALIEEFIRGAEFTVAIIGNKQPEVFAPVQVHIDNDTNLGDRFYTFSFISSGNLGYIYPADINDDLKEKLCDLALKVYRAVDCRDFGRVDFRVDEQGQPYVLEINPLPCLATADVFTLISQIRNIPYSQMIGRILNAAIDRHRLTGR